MYGAIAALGVGIELAFEHSHQDPLAEATRWILAGATALYLVGAILVRASAQPDPPLVLVHVVAIGVVLLVAAFGSSWSAAVVVTMLAATLVARARLQAGRARETRRRACAGRRHQGLTRSPSPVGVWFVSAPTCGAVCGGSDAVCSAAARLLRRRRRR